MTSKTIVLAGSSSKATLRSPTTLQTIVQSGKESKDEKRKTDETDEYVICGIERPASVLDHTMMKALLSQGKGRGLKSANATYRMLASSQVDFTADSSGLFAGSTRIGDPTIWTGYSTFNTVFQRFRVVRVEVLVARNPANSNIGVLSDMNVMYLDTSVATVTPVSHLGAFAAPAAKLYSTGGGYGFAPSVAKPILRSKVKPEKEWFDLNSEKQLGCVAVYSTGNTHSQIAQSWFIRYTVEFSGLLI
jgi:hypothetical protein